ncbi:hypothetical protein [Roseateles hydrophilus]|uniref:hypothetical protein n=1 Tax=Roseateles hydrophilus TaxID=2975054 RepID=UPI00227AD4B0|nr:hypothetical protein [Pelomonas sp. UHG3]
MTVAQQPNQTASAVEALLRSLISTRKPRPVVTPRGRRARGFQPSYKQAFSKSSFPRFESLVEDDVLRVLEVAASVSRFVTQPYVVDLSDNGYRHDYTPDAEVTLQGSVALMEAKGDHWLTVESARTTLARNARRLKTLGIPFLLLLESDARPSGLQVELKLLLRERPACNPRRRGLDPTQWDPSGTVQPTGHQLRRWRDAQKECDALLDRVMRRDPDEVLARSNA